jgi:hypothetical protein
MQNKMHYAATELTAASRSYARAPTGTKPNIGLTSWSGSRVLKRDAGTAKNYLLDGEIDTLNRIVVMFLDRAEFRAQRRKDVKMADWEVDLDKFLVDTELPVPRTQLRAVRVSEDELTAVPDLFQRFGQLGRKVDPPLTVALRALLHHQPLGRRPPDRDDPRVEVHVRPLLGPLLAHAHSRVHGRSLIRRLRPPFRRCGASASCYRSP